MSHRLQQVNELLQKELSLLVAKDLSPVDYFVTVSYVECSTDLSLAKVGVTVLPEKKEKQALKELKKKNSSWQAILGKKLNLKRIPHLRWRIDNSLKKVEEINKILKQIKNE